ncbi:MAG: replicative DNA helicase [Bacilli bacterium]
MKNKNMPNNIEAEQAVIGSMFLSKYALQKACETLAPESFYLDKNAKIFKVLKDLAEKHIPVDSTTVTGELKQRNIINEIGGYEYLAEVMDSVPTAANIEHYIKLVEDCSLLRRLIETSTEITTLGYNSESEINETLDEAEKKILGVVKNRRSTEFRTIQDVLVKTQSDLEILSKSKGEITGLPSGFSDLDKLTAGFHENEFIIIAARPAMGKTAFALNMATHIAINTDKTVALFNLEMGAEQLANRMISSLGQIDGSKLRTGYLQNADWKRVNEAISQLTDAKLLLDDTPGITIGEIRAKCRRLASTDDGLGIVIIDYLQLISGGGKYGSNRQQEVSDISRALKTMAMELKVPVIALAQLSRNVEGREEKRPLMSDLRESGSLEQDADIVAFLYREDYYNKQTKTDDNTSKSELIIGKHRNGPTATVNLIFKRDTSTFLNYKEEPNGEKHE